MVSSTTILDYDRGQGKTFRCILESVATGNHILVGTKQHAQSIYKMAKIHSLDHCLPEVFTCCELKNGYRGGSFSGVNFIIDEAEEVLKNLLNDLNPFFSCSMMTFTATERKIKSGTKNNLKKGVEI